MTTYHTGSSRTNKSPTPPNVIRSSHPGKNPNYQGGGSPSRFSPSQLQSPSKTQVYCNRTSSAPSPSRGIPNNYNATDHLVNNQYGPTSAGQTSHEYGNSKRTTNYEGAHLSKTSYTVASPVRSGYQNISSTKVNSGGSRSDYPTSANVSRRSNYDDGHDYCQSTNQLHTSNYDERRSPSHGYRGITQDKFHQDNTGRAHLTTSPSKQTAVSGNKVGFSSAPKDPEQEERKKYLTARYGQHQMRLIRKRLQVESWLDDQLTLLFRLSEEDSCPCDVDIDEVMDFENRHTRRDFVLTKVIEAPQSPEKINAFVEELLNKIETL